MSFKTGLRIARLLAVALLIGATLTAPSLAFAAPNPQPKLKLVSARDNISGSFVTSQSVYATKNNIYLASSQGTLFVLKRSKTENFPVVESVNIGSPLTSVRGYGTKLFVASADGYLRQYSTTNPLTLVKSVQLSTYGLGAIAITNNTVYVARGSGSLAVDGSNVYLAELNEGDVAMELNGQLAITKTYGQTFEPDVTVVYNRTSGNRVGTVANPTTVLNTTGFPSLFAFSNNLFQTVPGCCGANVQVTANQNLTTTKIVNQSYSNAVTLNTKGLVIGDEAGKVSLYKFSNSAINFQKSLDLRQLTNHTGSEDIEIRSVWSDGNDNLVFAASSWGNSSSQSPSLPSLFVLEIN